MNPYPLLAATCAPLIESYHEDLTKHDQAWICDNPDVPFLHWTRRFGTCLVGLHPADHPGWPRPGLVVPYLFGHATREHILDQVNVMAAYWLREPVLAVHHFDGTHLHVVTVKQAVDIAGQHVFTVGCAWNTLRHQLRPAAYNSGMPLAA